MERAGGEAVPLSSVMVRLTVILGEHACRLLALPCSPCEGGYLLFAHSLSNLHISCGFCLGAVALV